MTFGTTIIYDVCRRLYGIIDIAQETADWLNELYDEGYAPALHILEVGIESEERAAQIKRYWTKHYHYVSQRDLPVVPMQDDLKRPRRQDLRSLRQPHTEQLRRIKEKVR